MAEKFNPDNTLSPQELAKHLRQPDGETGKQIGLQMNKGNQYICLNSYKALDPKDGNRILEIGMGNGFFIKDLFAMANDLTYAGVDFSETMVQEARLLNQEKVEDGSIKFEQASIEKLPFEDASFHGITTTNTLYFWPQPKENIQELLRVLKPDGKLLVAYRPKSCMDQLELANHGFEKYESSGVEQLFSSAGFKNISTQMIKEPELDFDGTAYQMEGIYTTGVK